VGTTTSIGVRTAGLPARVVAEVRAAIGLLTRIPVPNVRDDRSGAAAFALIGAGIGLGGAVPMLLVGATEPFLGAVGAIAVMALLSGGLHLDGLADTADALLVADRARAERARSDPAIGAGGAVTLILVLAAEVGALASLASGAPVLAAAACVAGGTVSRLAPVVLPALAGDRQATSGLGAWFVARIRTTDVVVAMASAAGVVGATAIVVGSGIPAIGAAIGLVVGLLGGRAIVAGRGQLDGDGLGATVELALAATLIACAIATP
jgi:adenosylcobinamide-GDP ribazoletransferase